MRNVLIFFLFIWTVTIVFAQPKQFSADSVEFVGQVEEFVGNSLQNEEEAAAFAKFISIYESDTLMTPDERAEIREVFNLFLKKKARPAPHYIDFIRCYINFRYEETQKHNFEVWKRSVIEVVTNRKPELSNLTRYLESTLSLVTQGNLYKSTSVTWKPSTNDYRFILNGGIFIELSTTDLVCYSKRDSIILYDTRGTYDPIGMVWRGIGGLITWERAGFSRDSVFARLHNYSIDMTGSDYVADSVSFTNLQFFDYPLAGRLEDKVKLIQGPASATYPRFDSYQKNFDIKNFYQDVNYSGGLSMQGARLVGTGNVQNPARLQFFRSDTLILATSSVYFAFKKDRVNAQNTAVVIYLGADSIFHPDQALSYITGSRELSLVRTEDFTSQGPYYNSYHRIDMSCDQLVWNLNTDVIRLTMPRGSTIGNARFKSEHFFNYAHFEKLQLRDPVHPLYSIKTFATYYPSGTFEVEPFANYMKKQLHEIRHLLMRMSYEGFIYFDAQNDLVTVKQKLYDYLNASINRIDYDVIDFNSVTNAPLDNGLLDLRTLDLTINGIPEIFLSDSQNVVLYPTNGQIKMKKNRGFYFSGTVDAGLFTFEGDNFYFSYDSFKIDLRKVDAVNIRYTEKGVVDGFGRPVVFNVLSKIENITGDLLIDEPDNKSGRKSLVHYPIFRSEENSFVYYDSPSIEGGTYKRDNFFFKLDPFEIDSLDNFNKDLLLYSGKLYSAGILPVLEDTLSIQPDRTLGLQSATPGTGLPVYGGKGQLFNTYTLNAKGLRANGRLSYLTSTTTADDFKFYPDSMNTLAQGFVIDERTTPVQYPVVRSKNNTIHWEPYNERLEAGMTSDVFKMITDTTFLNGRLVLEPSGLSGTGTMDLKNSVLTSTLFTYKAKEIFSDTADFRLRSIHTSDFTVLTDNVRAYVDYTTRKGNFQSNEDYSLVEFPENQYISYLDNFDWYMDRKELEMRALRSAHKDASDTLRPQGPQYVSVHPDQDSLNFVSPLANYNYEKNQIKATGVDYILVADAKIIPFDGKVTIEQKAKMQRLEKAIAECNQVTRHHRIHTASLDIQSRNSYTGRGKYDYIDENGGVQVIEFQRIEVDTSLRTIANGAVVETDTFTLSPVYRYQGKVTLYADRKHLTFKGSVFPNHGCHEFLGNEWLAFESEIDPKAIFIPIGDQPQNINRSKIFAGPMISSDSIHIYSTFLTPRKFYSDQYIASSDGFMFYDKTSVMYKIASKDKLMDYTLSHDYQRLQADKCIHYAEGAIDLGVNLGQMNLTTFGSITRNLSVNNTQLDLLLGLQFLLDPKASAVMAKDIDSLASNAPVDLQRDILLKSWNRLLGTELATKVNTELSLFGTLKNIPKELQVTLLLNELKPEWNEATKSYRYKGKIGVGFVAGKQVNKRVDGYFQLFRKRSGDVMDLYFKINNNTWYYFGYTRGVMQVLSSNAEFNTIVRELSAGDRTIKAQRTETPYIYLLSTDQKYKRFLRRYNSDEVEDVDSEEDLPEELR